MESKEKSFKSGPQSLRVGIDLVEIGKVRKHFEGRKDLRESIFTSEELRYSWKQKTPYAALAVLFAVKEAFFKALGTGLSGKMDWRDVEVGKGTEGTAVLRLCGETARIAEEMGVINHVFSLSHTKEYGIAIVLLAAIALQEPLGKMGPIPGQSINLL